MRGDRKTHGPAPKGLRRGVEAGRGRAAHRRRVAFGSRKSRRQDEDSVGEGQPKKSHHREVCANKLYVVVFVTGVMISPSVIRVAALVPGPIQHHQGRRCNI